MPNRPPRRQRCQGPCGKLFNPEGLHTIQDDDGTRKRLCDECMNATQGQLFEQAQAVASERHPADPDDVSLADAIEAGGLKPASEGTKRRECVGSPDGAACTLLDGGKPKPVLRGLDRCEVHQREFDAARVKEQQQGQPVAQPAAAGADQGAGAPAEPAPVPADQAAILTMYATPGAGDHTPVTVPEDQALARVDEGFGIHYADADRLGLQGRPGIIPTVHNIGGEVVLSLPPLQVSSVPLEGGGEAVFTDNGEGGSRVTVVEPDVAVLTRRPRHSEGPRPEGWPLKKAYVSASALSEFARCGESFRRKYVEGIYGASSGASVTGTALHAALEYNWQHVMAHGAHLTVEQLTDVYAKAFTQEVRRQMDWNGIEWGGSPDDLRAKGQRALVSYEAGVMHTVQPAATEEPFSLSVPGVPVPVVGVIDLRTTDNRVVDVKSGAKVSKAITPDWRMAAFTYLLAKAPKSVDYHSTAYSGSIATPDTDPGMRLELTPDTYDVAGRVIAQRVAAILAYAQQFGLDGPWPDGLGHMYACKGCAFRPTCPWWHAQTPPVLV